MYVALVPTLVKVRSVVVTPFTTTWTRNVSYAVEPDSAVSVRIQYDSDAAVAVEGIVTDWVRFSVDVVPLPPNQAL